MPTSGLAGTATTYRLRYLVLAGICLDLLLIGGRVLLYPPLLAQHTALGFVFAPVGLLLLYAGLTLAITARPSPQQAVALRTGMVLGLLTGALWLVNLALETFADVSGIRATPPLLLGAFAGWAAAGFWSARRTGRLREGLRAAVCSAMICVLLTITFGFALTYTSLARLEQNLVADPDYLRSQWTDLRAFAIANTFDAGFSHLLGALLVSMLVGTVGSVMGMLSTRWSRYRPITLKHTADD